MQTKLVLFDIDGTLLYSTNHALRMRFIHAIDTVYGIKTTLDWSDLEGSTDTAVFQNFLKRAGVKDEEISPKLEAAHEAAYSHFVNIVDAEEYKSTILPGAEAILMALQPKVNLGVLTGNYEKTAWHKLMLVGLRDYFTFGLFGHEADNRNSLAQLVHKKAKHFFGIDFAADQIFIIGDTPKDIECAKTIHAQVIAVPTGKYSAEELEAHKPDLLAKNLEDQRIIKYILGK